MVARLTLDEVIHGLVSRQQADDILSGLTGRNNKEASMKIVKGRPPNSANAGNPVGGGNFPLIEARKNKMKYTVKELCDKKVAILTPTFEAFKVIVEMLKKHRVGGVCMAHNDKALESAFNTYGKNTFVIVVHGFLPFMSNYCLIFGDKADIDDDCIIDEGRNFVFCKDGIETSTNHDTTPIEDGKYIAERGAWKFFRPLTSEEKALL